jgi:hypothetical protein
LQTIGTYSGVKMSKLTCAYITIKLSVLMMLLSCGPQPTKKVSVVGAYNGPSRWEATTASSPGLNIALDPDLQDTYGGAVYTMVDQMKDKWDDQVASKDLFTGASSNNELVSDPVYADIKDYYYAESSPILGIYIRDASEGWFSGVSSSALAVTQYFGTVDPSGYLKIIHADIFINSAIHNFSLNQTSGAYHLPTVILHELGHFLGLHHSSGFSDVMYPSLAQNYDKSALSDGDKTAIRNLYEGSSVSAFSGQGFVVGHQSSGEDEDAIYRGVIELHASGECKHYLNDKLIHSH